MSRVSDIYSSPTYIAAKERADAAQQAYLEARRRALQGQQGSIWGGLARSAGQLGGMFLGANIVKPLFDKGWDALPSMGSIFGGSSSTPATTVATGDLSVPMGPISSGVGSMFSGGMAPATTAASESAPAAISSTGLLGSMGSMLPLAGGALGAYGLYDTFAHNKSKAQGGFQGAASGAALGASLGSAFPGVGTAIGAGVGGLAGGIGGLLAGQDKPHPETQDRGTALDELRQSGVLGEGNTLAGGGVVGNPRSPSTYNIDLANAGENTPLGQTVGMVDPLSEILVDRQTGSYNTADRAKRRSDMTGMLANALMQGGTTTDEIRQQFAKAGLDRNEARKQLDLMWGAGKIDQGQHDAEAAALDRLFNVRNSKAPAEDQARFDEFQAMANKGPLTPMSKWSSTPPVSMPQLPQPMPEPVPQPDMGVGPQAVDGMSQGMTENAVQNTPNYLRSSGAPLQISTGPMVPQTAVRAGANMPGLAMPQPLIQALQKPSFFGRGGRVVGSNRYAV